MHRAYITANLNSVLRAGRQGVEVELMDFHIDRDRDLPFSSVEEMATAGKGAGIAVEELNINQVEREPEDRDRDPVRDLVLSVFETDD